MAIASFAPTAGISLYATATSQAVLLPTTGTPTIAMVTNMGESFAFVQLGTSSAVAVNFTSLPIAPKGQVALTIGANTYIAAVALGVGTNLSIIVGS